MAGWRCRTCRTPHCGSACWRTARSCIRQHGASDPLRPRPTMESIDTILETLKGMHDSDRLWTIARKVALNEAYFNVGLIDVIETKAVQGSRSDRNKLIMKLQTASRGAFDIYNIDKGLFGKLIHRARNMI